MAIPQCSDFWNVKSTRGVPDFVRGFPGRKLYDRAMSRAPHHDWFLEQWMATAGVATNEQMRKLTGWSKRKASDLISGEQRYNRDTLNEAALALNCAPFELLLHPDDAMRIRRWRADIEAEAVRLVAEKPAEFQSHDTPPLRSNGTSG